MENKKIWHKKKIKLPKDSKDVTLHYEFPDKVTILWSSEKD